MGTTTRYYLFATDGVKRLSMRLLDGLTQGTDTIPEYAGTKQKVASVILRTENGSPEEIIGSTGTYFDFDSTGNAREELLRGAMEAMETHKRMPRGDGKVVPLGPSIDRQNWEKNRRWSLSKKVLDLIAADIWKRGKRGAPKVKQAKGTAPKRPPLTYKAEEALTEIHTNLISVGWQLDKLSEPALKGLAFEANRRANERPGDPRGDQRQMAADSSGSLVQLPAGHNPVDGCRRKRASKNSDGVSIAKNATLETYLIGDQTISHQVPGTDTTNDCPRPGDGSTLWAEIEQIILFRGYPKTGQTATTLSSCYMCHQLALYKYGDGDDDVIQTDYSFAYNSVLPVIPCADGD